MNIIEKNKLNIDKRILSALKLLKQNYELQECDTSYFSHLNINKMNYTIKQYEVKGVGNLVVMVCKEPQPIQMDSIVITPYYKNLPLFSTDYIYMKEKRSFLNEIYSLTDNKDELYNKYMKKFIKIKDKYRYLEDMPTESCWYDDLRTVCIAKNTDADNDDEIIKLFEKNLELFIKMEKKSPVLNEEQYKRKWQKTQDYTDALVNDGGVSTNVFKAVLGEDKTKEFFNRVFFACELYKK